MIVDDVEVTITKKKIKNINLYVKAPDGRVMVSAPIGISDEKIARFVRSKLDWIRKKQEKFANQQVPIAMQYVSGELFYVWGRQYILQIVYDDKNNSLVLDGDNAIFTVSKNSTAEQKEKYVNEWYRKILKAEIARILPKWEDRTGLYAQSWQIRNMKTRWGSCNVKTKKIWLNLQLAKKDTACLEYVILHELLHLQVPNHGKTFIALMDKYMPEWRNVKNLF